MFSKGGYEVRVQFQPQLALIHIEKKLVPHEVLKRSNDVLGRARAIDANV